MSLRALTKNKQGFTIIEVMIVLAIAGLIVLVVFLAVPALQRNSRNTQRKQDVQAVLGAIQEWISLNGSNKLPDAPATALAVVESAGLGYYKDTEIFINKELVVGGAAGNMTILATGAGNQPTPLAGETPNHDDRDFIYIWSDANCSGATPPRADGGGPSKSIAVEFAVETSSGSQVECRAF